MSEDKSCLERVLAWLGRSLAHQQKGLLVQLCDWLRSEALVAGGIGPAEGERIWERHICDSLSFAAAWPPAEHPRTAIDIGSGVGLPGLPLAILWPDTGWTLLDRSGRRADLARRAVRVLGLTNVSVLNESYQQHSGTYEGAVARAVADPGVVVPIIQSLLTSEGRGVIGVGRADGPPDTVPRGTSVLTIPREVLDGEAKILIIEPCDR